MRSHAASSGATKWAGLPFKQHCAGALIFKTKHVTTQMSTIQVQTLCLMSCFTVTLLCIWDDDVLINFQRLIMNKWERSSERIWNESAVQPCERLNLLDEMRGRAVLRVNERSKSNFYLERYRSSSGGEEVSHRYGWGEGWWRSEDGETKIKYAVDGCGAVRESERHVSSWNTGWTEFHALVLQMSWCYSEVFL